MASGTPGAGELGIYAGISVGVTDGSVNVQLATFSIEVVGTAVGSATLSWVPPTERSDGTLLGAGDLAGYKIYWGMDQGNYSNSVTIDNPGLSAYVVDLLTPATWFFVVTAYDSQGLESPFSNVASKAIL